MERISLDQLLAATGGAAVGIERHDAGFDRLCLDSRRIAPGDLFWAVRGELHDGHDFAADALAGGALACVVAENRAAEIMGPKVVVGDTQKALGDFARWYRRTKRALVLGITGSVGKTTTREIVHSVLSVRLRGIRSPKNYNNQFGLPLSVLEIESQHDFAVLELGASRAGEIRGLASVAVPEVGIVTAVGEAHLETFGDIEHIAQEKGELIAALPPSGLAVLAGDDPRVRGMANRARCRTILVGEGAENHVRASDMVQRQNRIQFRVDQDLYELRAIGLHHVRSALCAIAVAREFGLRPDEIAAGLEAFTPAPGRCRLERIGPWWVIDDTYNASPGSLHAACGALRRWAGSGKRFLVAGDMLELGERSAELHYAAGYAAAGAGLDGLFALGPQSRELVRGARDGGMETDQAVHCAELNDVLVLLEQRLHPGEVVLVKGSRGMRMERVIEWLRNYHAGPQRKQGPNQVKSLACASG